MASDRFEALFARVRKDASRAVLAAAPLLEFAGISGLLRRLARAKRGLGMRPRLWMARLANPIGRDDIREVDWCGHPLVVNAGEAVGRAIAYRLPFESFELELVQQVTQTGDVFFDVGSNFGLFTVAVTKSGRHDVRIHAFEANPSIFPLLERNCANLVNGSKGHAINCAIGDREGHIDFYCASDSAYSSAIDTRRSKLSATVRVRQVSIDGYLASVRLGSVDVMKIDVEGYEPEVLAGAERLLSRSDAPVLLIEVAAKNLQTRNLSQGAVFRRLEGLGFSIMAAAPGLPPISDIEPAGFENFVCAKANRMSRLFPLRDV